MAGLKQTQAAHRIIMEISLLVMEKSWNLDFEFLWEPCNRILVVGRPSVVHNAQRSSPKPLGQSKPNFLWSLLG